MEASKGLDVAVFLAIGMLALFLLAGGVVVFFVIYQKRILQQQLQLTEMEKSYQEELLHSNIEQVETERHRIAADLHDEVGSIFSTLKLKINQLQKDRPEQKLLEESSEIIDSGIQTVRRISHELVPPSLEMFGLADALASLAGKMSTPQMEISLNCADDFPRLPVKVELGLYRIAQELLNNATRHSGAGEIALELEESGNNVTFAYTDNGSGISPEILNARKGLGIRNIEVRARQLGGQVQWQSAPGKGLHVIIRILQTPLS